MRGDLSTSSTHYGWLLCPAAGARNPAAQFCNHIILVRAARRPARATLGPALMTRGGSPSSDSNLPVYFPGTMARLH